MPSKESSKEHRRKWLHELCLKYVDTYVMANSEVEPLVQQVHELEGAARAGFLCRPPSTRGVWMDVTRVMFTIPIELSK